MGAEHVFALGTERGISSATGRPYTTHSTRLWTAEHGLIRRLRVFHDTAAMAAALAG